MRKKVLKNKKARDDGGNEKWLREEVRRRKSEFRKNRKIWNQLKCGKEKQEFDTAGNKEMKGKLRKKSVHVSPCAGSVKNFIACFLFGLYRPFSKYLQDWVRRCQTPPYRRRDIHVIYSTIYSAIYSHRAHDVDESPEDHQGHIKRLYCTLFPALHPLRTLIYSSPPPKENKGVTRPLLTAAVTRLRWCHRRGLILQLIDTKKALFLEVPHCLICGHWATRSLPVTAGSPLRLFPPVTLVIFRIPRSMCPVLSACVRVCSCCEVVTMS